MRKDSKESAQVTPNFAKVGDNQGFILMHSVGSLPNGSEIDTPLNYADYYYLEALKRFMDLKGINYKDI